MRRAKKPRSSEAVARLARTGDRLRAMSSHYTDVHEDDGDTVKTRLQRLSYGAPKSDPQTATEAAE